MANISVISLILLPVYAGILLLFFSKSEKVKKNTSFFIFCLNLVFASYLFLHHDFLFSRPVLGYRLNLGLDQLSRLILLLANFLGLLICTYCRGYMKGKKNFFSFLLWLSAFVNLEIMAQSFPVFIFAWGFCILILYSLLRLGSNARALKALVILGFSYACFIAGAYLYSGIIGSSRMPSGAHVLLNNPVCWIAFLLMLAGALAKAGSGPFHTWIPSASETAPVPVMAILPASLDKLLGIYILCRLSLDFFQFNSTMTALLLVIGSLTIIFAVMMALIQHDARVLLSYHAISQAGYMVLGIGTGNPIGIVGALFHMVNNAIYKNGLFLICGVVKKKRKTFKLEQLGGLAKYMPLTFIAGLIFSLGISGIPPFNGFFSKWMIYKGVLAGLVSTPNIFLRAAYLFALVSAMFGSVLTLASFIKFLHAIFLGQENSKDLKPVSEPPKSMLIPLLSLAGLCVALGVFSHLFVSRFLGSYISPSASYSSIWDSTFIIVSIIAISLAAFAVWGIKHLPGVRSEDCFAGGEEAEGNFNFPATEFYKTVEELPVVAGIYKFLHFENLDLYNILKSCFSLGRRRKSIAKPQETQQPAPSETAGIIKY